MTKLLLALLLIPAIAFAERPTLNVYYVVAPDAIPFEYVSHIVSSTKASIKEEFGVAIKVRVRKVKNNYIPYNLGTRYTQFKHWYYKYAVKQKRKWSLAITPPYYDNGQQYLAGLGHDVCAAQNSDVKYVLAMMTAELTNERGQDRYPHTLKGIMHELGHNLGLDHNETAVPMSVMHPNLLHYVNTEPLLFTAKEREKGRTCLLKWKN